MTMNTLIQLTIKFNIFIQVVWVPWPVREVVGIDDWLGAHVDEDDLLPSQFARVEFEDGLETLYRGLT